jgi:hypothetical protein
MITELVAGKAQKGEPNLTRASKSYVHQSMEAAQ